MTTTTYDSKVIADSMSPEGVRLTTLEVTFPRIVLAEFNTHRVFSRSSASSRAVPIGKRIEMVEKTPYIPASFGSNQAGMQSGDPLDGKQAELARATWVRAARDACASALDLADLGVHKEYANRLLEPFLWHTVVVTSTEWENYFALRCHPAASEPIRLTSELMCESLKHSKPAVVDYNGWHLPYVDTFDQGMTAADLAKVSAARCARVSYLTHDGVRDLEKDLELYKRLAAFGHMAPLEHPARPARFGDRGRVESEAGRTRHAWAPSHFWFGNFRGWVQHRKELPSEDVFRG